MKEKYNRLNNEIQQFVDKIEKEAEKPLYKMTPDEAAAFLDKIQEQNKKEIPAYIFDTEISTSIAGNVPLRFIRPLNTEKEKLPLIVYVHGGGWVMGNENTHNQLVRKLAVNTGCCIAFVKYTRSPLAAFPLSLNQVYAVLDFLYNNPDEYNIDTTRIIIAGDSAGANMASAAAMKAKNENGAKILFQLLLYPALDAKMETKSYKQYKKGPWLTKKAMKWFWNAYIQDKTQFNNFYAVPISMTVKDLENMPPALIITAENDVLRNEGEEYSRKLNTAGVKSICVRILGTCHDFMMLNAISDTPPVKAAFELVYGVINKVLKNDFT